MHSDENADEQMKDHYYLRALTVQFFAEFSFNNGSIKTTGTEITLQIFTDSKNVLSFRIGERCCLDCFEI